MPTIFVGIGGQPRLLRNSGGKFGLSGAVMTIAFILVLGLPEITLRGEIEETSAT